MFVKVLSRVSKPIIITTLVVLIAACNATGVGHALHVTLDSFNKGKDANTSEYTLVYLTRHAEKRSDQGKDPSLTSQGQKRAENLAYALSKSNLDVIFSTDYKRTRETATPTSEAQKLDIFSASTSAKTMAETITSEHLGRKILVVGHSNTTPVLLAQLGVKEQVTINEDQYGDLFLVILKGDEFEQMIKFNF